MRLQLRLTSRMTWLGWSIAATVAFALHVYLAANVCCPDEPLGVDGVNYEQAAVLLLRTGNLFDPLLLWNRAYWPPLWPLTLAALYTVFGHNLFAARVFESALVIVTSLCTFRLGTELFDRRTGLIAGVLIAFSPTLFIYATLQNYEVLITLLLIASLYLYVRSRRAVTRQREIAILALGAFLFGLGILTKAILLSFLPFLALWEYSQTAATLLSRAKRLTLFAMISMLTVLPWTARNYLVYHELILVNSNGEVTFEIGNNPYATGGYWIPPVWATMELSGTPMARGIEFIRDNPVRFLNLIPIKIGNFWSQEPIFTHANDVIRLEPLTTFGQTVLQPLNEDVNRLSIIWLGIGAAAALLGSRQSSQRQMLVGLVIGCFSLVHFVFHGEARFRVPLYPWISLLQAYAAVFLVRTVPRFVRTHIWQRGSTNVERIEHLCGW